MKQNLPRSLEDNQTAWFVFKACKKKVLSYHFIDCSQNSENGKNIPDLIIPIYLNEKLAVMTVIRETGRREISTGESETERERM